MKLSFALLLGLLFFGTTLFGQSAYELDLKNGKILMDDNPSSFLQDFQLQTGDLFQGHYYLVVQFDQIPTQNVREEITALGVELLDYLPRNAYIASIPQGFNLSELVNRGARSFLQPDQRLKLSPEIYSLDIPEHAIIGEEVEVLVSLYSNVNKADVLPWFQENFIVENAHRHPKLTTLRLRPNQFETLMDAPFVKFISPGLPTPIPDDREGRSLHRSNVLNADYGAGRHYDGSGVTIGLADDGPIGPHIDYTGRLTQLITGAGGSHGDMTAGILFGAGNRDPLIRGHATGAYLYYWDIGGYVHIADAVQNYNQWGVTLTSTSYSQGQGGVYDGTTAFIDEQIYDNDQLIHVFSAGNAGTSNHGYGAGAGWGNITGGRKAGKSVVTCANLDFLDNLENSSSRGPADDGRIKPDISANGFEQLSTAENNSNQVGGGTSAAAPSVAGTITQLYQAYRELNNGAEPVSPLIKAAVLNTAEDLGNAGPDFQHGWGRINGLGAVRVFENNTYLKDSITQGQTKTHTITVPANTGELRAMVYWLDPEGNTSAARALVNDLNMTVTDPGASVWNPWILDHTPNAAALNSVAVRGTDTINNMEQVTLTNPAMGTYTVTVNGSSIPMGPQEYYVVWENRPLGIDITYPIGGEGFATFDLQTIRWDATGLTNSINLEYSTDGGTSWNTINSSVPASSRFYNWNVPAVISGQARVRATSGSYTDMSDEDFTIVNVPTNLQVTYACPDSIGLSWNSVAGVSGYEVSYLGAEYMDSIGTTSATNIAVTGLNPTLEHWFSVKSLTADGGAGRRAIAIQFMGGTFNCSLPVDAGLEALVSPSAGAFPDCQASSNTDITIDVSNNGNAPLTNIPVSYQINANAPVNETLPGPIAPGATAQYTFTQTANLATIGSYNISTWVTLGGDQNSFNDTTFNAISVYASSLVALPLTENFESFGNCPTTTNCEATSCALGNGWINATNLDQDDIDWRVDDNGTTSQNTGPSTDHNPGTSQGNYIYTEASGGCTERVAHLLSPCIDLSTAVNPEMEYWYHMLGGDMGELHVDVLSEGSWDLDVVFPIVGNQGNLWRMGTINLGAYVGKVINVRFRGVTGGGFESDLALDDINIFESSVAPVAMFEASPSFTCPGNTVTLNDLTQNTPSSWAWTITPNTFNYVNGTSASSQNPEVQFNATGTYSVTLVATNANGSDTEVQSSAVTISNGNAIPLVEDFENLWAPSGWQILDFDSDITWDIANNIQGPISGSTDAAFVNNYDYDNPGEEDELVTFPIDLTNALGAQLTFDVAYAPYDNQSRFDGLRIDISTDCGATFNASTYNKSGSTLGTAPATTSRWAPNGSTQWRNELLDLAPYLGNKIVISFVNINGHGNNLFIDNVNITGAVGIEDALSNLIKVYPNPNDGQFRLEIGELPVGTSSLGVLDLTGREVFRKSIEGNGSAYTADLDLRNLAKGVYYLELRSETGRMVSKLVIEE